MSRQNTSSHPPSRTLLDLLSICLAISVFVTPATVAAQNADGFVSLLEGDDLGGWVETGAPGAFTVSDGVLFLEHPQNHPNWLRSAKPYENFVLELEYQPVGWAEGGIYLHAPLHGDPVHSGLKIHLRHDRTEEGARSTGAIYDVRPPITMANKPGNEWNRLVIHMDWPSLRVTLNDTLIQKLDLRTEELRYRLREGYVGFEDIGTRFRFRNVRIRELPDTEPAWTTLFNGLDLSGWDVHGEAEWAIEGGVLVGSGGDGLLTTRQSFSTFEFQTYFRTSPHANGGVFYRVVGSPEERSHYEIQIYNVPTATNPTGSIYGIVPAADAGCRSGEWCLMQLISDGPTSRVLINGRTVAEAEGLARPDSGRIAIQNHSQGAIEYKGLRIKSLRE